MATEERFCAFAQIPFLGSLDTLFTRSSQILIFQALKRIGNGGGHGGRTWMQVSGLLDEPPEETSGMLSESTRKLGRFDML